MKNQYVVTPELYKSWCLESMFRGRRLAFSIFWIVMLIFCSVCAILSKHILFVIYALFCAYQVIFRIFLVAKINYKNLVKTYGQVNWTRTIEFFEGKIYLEEGNIKMDLLYSNIVKTIEKDDNMAIYFNNKTLIRVYKNAFVDGSFEQCKELVKK